MRRLAGVILAAVLALAGTANAQDVQQFSLPPPILIIDIDRLVAETQSGARITDELEARAAALSRENEEIQTQLITRERELTELRATLSPEEFKALADSFDAEVQRIRAEQDEKEREIIAARQSSQEDFLNRAAPVISAIASERGALVVLDRREVFLSTDSIDITNEAIERINAVQE